MIRAAIIVVALITSGCSTTVPVTVKFPLAPPELMKQCEQLKQVVTDGKNQGVPITELLKTVVENYQLYYECRNRVEGWHDWYRVQSDLWQKSQQ
jgi:hypothetical protein